MDRSCFHPVDIYPWIYVHESLAKTETGRAKDRTQNPFQVPCGKCVRCRKFRSYDWVKRLDIEKRSARTSYFITLTYDEDNIPCKRGVKTLWKKDLQDFMKRIRRAQEREYEIYQNYGLTFPLDKREKDKWIEYEELRKVNFVHDQLRYFAVGEYGSKTFRPHYHLILFNFSPIQIRNLDKYWKFGSVKVGTVTPASMAYCSNYIMEGDNNENSWRDKQFNLMSKRPYMGYEYVEKNKAWIRNRLESTMLFEGKKTTIPRTLYNKVYSDKHPDGRKYEFKSWKAIIGSYRKEKAMEQYDELIAILEEKGITISEHRQIQEHIEVTKYNKNKKVSI